MYVQKIDSICFNQFSTLTLQFTLKIIYLRKSNLGKQSSWIFEEKSNLKLFRSMGIFLFYLDCNFTHKNDVNVSDLHYFILNQ